MKKFLIPMLAIAVVAIGTGFAQPESSTEREIRRMIVDNYDFVRQNLRGQSNMIAQDGALEFWSSGGLMQEVPAGSNPESYSSFTVRPKHIRVKTLVDGRAAVAMFYAEGAMTPSGSTAVSNYLTRATLAFVKEGGSWKISAAHYSPVAGGAGTSQTAMPEDD